MQEVGFISLSAARKSDSPCAMVPGELLRNLTPPFTLTLGKSKPRKASPTTTTTAMATSTAAQQQASQLFLISPNDEIYENDILRNPGSIKPWLDYAHFKRQYGSVLEQAFVLERACVALPRSYKLWKLYLELRVSTSSVLFQPVGRLEKNGGFRALDRRLQDAFALPALHRQEAAVMERVRVETGSDQGSQDRRRTGQDRVRNPLLRTGAHQAAPGI